MYSLVGPPGAGKSTQVQLLANQGFQTVSMGDLLREQAPARILQQMKDGLLVDNSYSNLLMAQRLDELSQDYPSDKIVIDGFPRSLEQAEWLLEDYKVDLKRCLHLYANEDILLERLLQRGRLDDKKEAILQRFEVYKTNMKEVLDYYLKREIVITKINANQDVNDIAADIRKALSFVQSA